MSDIEIDEEKQEQEEREELLERRRERQAGKKRPRKLKQKVLILGAGTILFGYFTVSLLDGIGVTNFFGPEKLETQAVSEVDLEVANKSPQKNQLDFIEPKAPEKEEKPKEEDPNIARLAELEEKLTKLIEASNKPDDSNARTQAALEKYKKDIQNEFDKQKDELIKEARERDANYERLLAEEKERRSELEKSQAEAAKRAEEARKNAQKSEEFKTAEQRRIESPSVILDGTKEIEVAREGAGSQSPDTNGSNNADTTASVNSGPERTEEDYSEDERFLASAAKSEFATAVSKKLEYPSRTVVQGTIISGVLETAINTELPGNIRGQVMEPVYSYDGTRILMPAGTVLIGTFNANVKLAQNRILIAWNRAITPAGESIALGSTGTDKLGRSGTAGNVNNRYGTKFGAAALISTISIIPSMISAASSATSSGSSDSGVTVNVGGESDSSGTDAIANVAGSVGSQSQSALEQHLSLPPIIQVPQGEEIRVFVNQDLVFE